MILKIGGKSPPGGKTTEKESKKEEKKKKLDCDRCPGDPWMYCAVLWCACTMSLISSGYSLYKQQNLQDRLSLLEEQHLALRSAVLEPQQPLVERLRREVLSRPPVYWRPRRSIRDYGDCVCPPVGVDDDGWFRRGIIGPPLGVGPPSYGCFSDTGLWGLPGSSTLEEAPPDPIPAPPTGSNGESKPSGNPLKHTKTKSPKSLQKLQIAQLPSFDKFSSGICPDVYHRWSKVCPYNNLELCNQLTRPGPHPGPHRVPPRHGDGNRGPHQPPSIRSAEFDRGKPGEKRSNVLFPGHGSPNYGPRAKSAPPLPSIRPTNPINPALHTRPLRMPPLVLQMSIGDGNRFPLSGPSASMPPPPGPGRRGRPKKCWLDVVKDEMRTNGLKTGDAEDRAKWTIAAPSILPILRSVGVASNPGHSGIRWQMRTRPKLKGRGFDPGRNDKPVIPGREDGPLDESGYHRLWTFATPKDPIPAPPTGSDCGFKPSGDPLKNTKTKSPKSIPARRDPSPRALYYPSAVLN
ncbi:hypothetical protein K1T71_006895 [Dendrolimus kikuchii]|uniref:Uncharacterized protein n=1 Tax=Dendrolimus kikuchii TaxID=765133 RepID=A0ACC1D2E8_9NEOP|nr:hypothetical protein K1T71_006895 [Dendrolimus kikuchii]